MNQKTIMMAKCALLLGVGMFSGQSLAEVEIGVGAAIAETPYRGYKTVSSAIPHIRADNGTFYLNTLSAGYYAVNTEQHQLTVGVSYLPLTFKPGDSDDWRMKRLDKRKSTLLAGMGYSLAIGQGKVSVNVEADVLDNSDSVLVSGDYSYLMRGDKWSIIPSAGAVWANSKHNNYYYGITRKEAFYSGLPSFNAGSSVTPYVQVYGNYALTSHIGIYAGARLDQLTGDLKDSPMTDNNTIKAAFTGVTYRF